MTGYEVRPRRLVAAFWVLRNPLAPKAVRLRDEYQRHIHELIAPAHFPLEIGNGLTKAERQKLISTVYVGVIGTDDDLMGNFTPRRLEAQER